MKRSILFSVIILSILLLPANKAFATKTNRGIELTIKTKAGTAVGLYRESHALVIGVSQYTGAWPKLPGVKKDVAAVSKALRENGFHVVVVEDPNQQELEAAFNDFILDYGLDPENRLLFYFAGHGYTLKPNYAMDDPEEWMGYIVSKDAPDPKINKAGFLRQAMSMQRVNEMALKIEADMNKDGYLTGSELGLFLQENVTNYSRRTREAGRSTQEAGGKTRSPSSRPGKETATDGESQTEHREHPKGN